MFMLENMIICTNNVLGWSGRPKCALDASPKIQENRYYAKKKFSYIYLELIRYITVVLRS
jgi:hypothetical protein